MRLFVILALAVNVLWLGVVALTLPANPAGAQEPSEAGEGRMLLLSGVLIATDEAVLIVEDDPPKLYRVKVHPWGGDQAMYRLVIDEARDAPTDAEQLVPLLRGRSVIYARCRGIRCGGERVK